MKAPACPKVEAVERVDGNICPLAMNVWLDLCTSFSLLHPLSFDLISTLFYDVLCPFPALYIESSINERVKAHSVLPLGLSTARRLHLRLMACLKLCNNEACPVTAERPVP